MAEYDAACPTCNQPIPDTKALSAEAVDSLMLTKTGTNRFSAESWYHLVHGYDTGYTVKHPILGTLTLVDQKEAESDSYGDIEDGEVYLVFSIGDGRHFKKDGEQSSYGGLTWSSGLREVKKVAKVVTVYEYE